ncbi:MAG: acyl-CoA dehydrogenase family protein, partial [Thermoleophilaceae bacterium]
RVRALARTRLDEARDRVHGPGRSREFVGELARDGLMGTLMPEAIGGEGLDLAHSNVVSQEIAAASPSLGAMRAISGVFVAVPVLGFGSRDQIERWLAPVCSGEHTLALGISEPDAGSDVRGITTRARRDGGDYLIEGMKHYISGASEAAGILTYCVTDPNADIDRRLSAFIVPTNVAGLDASEAIPTMGLRGLTHARVRYDGARVSAADRVGDEGDGLAVMRHGLDPERIDIASRSLGCGTRAFEEACDHAARRRQFGKPLRAFQAVSHDLADMRVLLDAAALLVLRAARLYDRGEPCTTEAAIAKLFAAERSHEVCDRALQVLGAVGYTEGNPVELVTRDVRALRFGGGTDGMMRHVIQRALR